MLPRLTLGEIVLPEVVVPWETVLLADLGFGLDLTSCAVTGATEGLAFVSPKTGRAVTREGSGNMDGSPAPVARHSLPAQRDLDARDWLDGLKLTGHFLTRDVFGSRHRPLPMARQMLYDRVAAMVAELENARALHTCTRLASIPVLGRRTGASDHGRYGEAGHRAGRADCRLPPRRRALQGPLPCRRPAAAGVMGVVPNRTMSRLRNNLWLAGRGVKRWLNQNSRGDSSALGNPSRNPNYQSPGREFLDLSS